MANRRKANLQLRNIDSCSDYLEFNPADVLESSTTLNVGTEEKLACTVCPERFDSIIAFKKHIRIHSGEKLYDCDHCHAAFSNSQGLKRHMLVHTDGRYPRCEICHSEFNSESNLTNHMLTHTVKKYYACLVCNQSFTTERSLTNHHNDAHKQGKLATTAKIHLEMHDKKDDNSQTVIQPDSDCPKSTESVSNPCTVCPQALVKSHEFLKHVETNGGKTFLNCLLCHKRFKNRRVLLKQHMVVHTGERKHKCGICGSGFVFRKSLVTHMVRHTGEKPYTCFACKRSFSTKWYLQNHRKKVHRNDNIDKDNITCKICPNKFVKSHDFTLHILMHSEKTFYKCLLCDQTLKSKCSLTKHMLVHFGVHKYKCDICSTTCSKQKGKLREHMKVHTGESPTCAICNKTFSTKDYLGRHMLIHQRIYKCEICYAKFKRKGNLREHMITHTDNRHTCAICNKSFCSKAYLVKHILIHNRKNYKCDVCEFKSHFKGDLKAHMLKHNDKRNDTGGISKSSFENRRSARLHAKNVHHGTEDKDSGPKPHACYICKNSFEEEWILYEHIKSLHSEQTDEENPGPDFISATEKLEAVVVKEES